MPIYTVGLGTHNRPRDLAFVRADAPEAVFHQDRVRGQITLKDDVPPGQPFTVRISDGDKVVWEQALTTENQPVRKIAYDFPIAELVQARSSRGAAGTQSSSVPVELQVSISGVEGDRELTNNDGSLRFRAVTQRRKILIVDGRPRWETRYLRNLFERDEQWEVNTVLPPPGRDAAFLRGDKPGSLPADAAALALYDLIIFGEVPRAQFKPDELQWMSDFVAQRGGAILFIDGPRGRLKEYSDTPLAALLPVEWKGAPANGNIGKLALTQRSTGLAAFTLASEREQNEQTWSGLKSPHWLANASALPGAEVLLEAESGGAKMPAMVYRPFGSGRCSTMASMTRGGGATRWRISFT
jgi:hypothetical protein